MGAKSSPRNGTRPTIVGIHTNEGPNPAGDEGRDRSAENLCAWMDGQQVSYHKVVDDDSVVHYVADDRYAWAMRSANRRSLNLCLIGRAAFSRDEWLRHTNMLRLAAAEVRGWCDRHRIPAVKLGPLEVGRDRAGVCGHVDWTYGKHDGSHTDPGPGFPWDVFMGLVIGTAPPGPLPVVTIPSGAWPLLELRSPLMRDNQPTGGPIWRVQDRLKRGYRTYAGGIDVDGIYGPQIAGVVREFQHRSALVVDGRVGPATRAALRL